MSVAKSWAGKSIYFILIDRFRNGDRSNDDFGQGEFDPKSDECFQGGDLKGVLEKLPHIKKLGFDAVWLTPPVHNQWINPGIGTRGYHGYWAYDFTKIDPHFGTLDDYKRLVEEAHRLGLKVIQDIVVNHTGNFFTVDAAGYDPRSPEKSYRNLAGAPNDPVFALNDPNVPAHKAAAVYNFTPNISDFRDRKQTLTWAMGDLDDINLKSPPAVERLKQIYRYWIEEAGVDGFRVDTVYYTPESFYERFLFEDGDSPGVKRFAAARGRKDFFAFGEVWSYDYGAINRYLAEGPVKRLDSAIDLPLNEALTQVFYRKAATERLRAALTAPRRNAALWVNFLDNHDVERMAARAGRAAIRQSLAALFTLPGIPCVYYGTEAGLTGPRQNMFPDAYFDERLGPTVFLRKLLRLRKRHPALSRGHCRVERASKGCGILAYSVRAGKDDYLMAFNTSSERRVADLGARRARRLLASPGAPASASGVVVLGPESYVVAKRAPGRGKAAPAAAALSRARVEGGEVILAVRRRGPIRSLFAVCDENYDRRIPVPPGAAEFRFPASELPNGRHGLRLLARDARGRLSLSPQREVEIRNPFLLLKKAALAPKDKAGLSRKLRAPAEPSYGGQLSMREVAAYASGRELRLVVSLEEVTDSWNPPNGYDHVYFSIFFGFPGLPGESRLPKLGYAAPGFSFNAGFLLYGWGSRSFGAGDSTPERYGAPLTGQIRQHADLAAKTVAFDFSEHFFGALRGFSGVKIFVSTWDGHLGELRGVAPRAQDWSFSPVDGASPDVPKVFDHVLFTL